MRFGVMKVALLAAGLVGCSTTYQFSGHIKAKDSLGGERNVIVSWKRTDHFLRMGAGAPGGEVIRLQTQCSAIPLHYVEKEDGIKFRNFEQKHAAFDDRKKTPEVCGEVMGYGRISSIEEGPLTLTVHCVPKTSRRVRDDSARRYIAGRIEPYRFQIEKRKLSGTEPEKDWSELLKCE